MNYLSSELILPECVKTNINKQSIKENCRYLVAPPIYSEDDVKSDIKQGLVCYSSILDNANVINGKYFIIDCETEEKGLISAHYISSFVRRKKQEFVNYSMDNYEFGEEELSEELLYEKSFEPWYCDRNNFPIISYDEVIDGISPMTYTYGNGTPYLLGGQNIQPMRKYWQDDLDNPVIIISHFEYEHVKVFRSSLRENIGQVFDYFKEHEMIFLLNVVKGYKDDRTVDDIAPEYGLSEADITKIILEYEAIRVNVKNNENTAEDINKLYLSQLLKSRELKLSANMKERNIINKMQLVEPEYPLFMAAKLFDYIKRNHPNLKCVSGKELKFLNVYKEATNKNDMSLDELVGMESVK